MERTTSVFIFKLNTPQKQGVLLYGAGNGNNLRIATIATPEPFVHKDVIKIILTKNKRIRFRLHLLYTTTHPKNRVCCCMEQVMGIEPTSKAWEALILPMNYTCKTI